MTQIRQGDVLLTPVPKIKGKPVEFKGKTILALGEMTGHHHRFETGNAVHFRDGGDGPGGASFFRVDKPAELIHEEHGTIVVNPGQYVQGHQVEYTPAELRRVAD